MLPSVLGSAGIGVVWGWLAGWVAERGGAQPLRTTLAILFATLVFALQNWWFVNWLGLAIFLGATLAALAAHVEWRRGLRGRL